LRTRYSAAQLLGHFRQLLPAGLLLRWLLASPRVFYQRAFTPLITLWYLVFQRLGFNHHLSLVQADALAGGADRLSPRGKPLSGRLHSEATTAYSDARQRLPLELCRRVLAHFAAQLHQALQVPRVGGLKIALLDGSTCRLRPHGDIPRHFPAHRSGNSKKPPYWCLARVVGILCQATGAVLDSALASTQISEQALCAQLLGQQSWAGWLLVADRNFGIYSVVRALAQAHAQALVRLTAARARKLARAAGRKLQPGLDTPVAWLPSARDQGAPEDRLPVAGRLLAIRVAPPGFRPLTLFLFTTLQDPAQFPPPELARLYGHRWHIELCFRHIKAQMDLGFLDCRSAEMARKEWLAGLIAYNLIRWAMGAAAALAQVPVQQLSFSRARELLGGWFARHAGRRTAAKAWQHLLQRIARARLPRRRLPRPAEPRAIRYFKKDVPQLVGSRADARQHLAKTNAKS
jgi:putative transposase